MEIVIAVALITISLFALAAVAQLSLRASRESLRDVKAAFLAEEGIEALRTMRDENWSNISFLTQDQFYHLIFSAGAWQATTDPQLIGGLFSRTFKLSPVYRDASHNIAPSGDLDTGARKIVLEVSWNNGAKKVALTSYITNLFED